jgi:cysteinyl-tRNA synthetase
VRYWLHAEHLLVDGEKMSKSLGNFYTLRDLFAKGHKPSSIRYLLASVPYRRQLNFTMDGLQQAASSVERLRNFVARMRAGKFPAGSTPAMATRAADAVAQFGAGLADDLNTAQALAAIFDLVREANTAMDQGNFRAGDAAPVLSALEKFDRIFAVLEDQDAARLRALGYGGGEEIADADVERLIAERQAARARRDFTASDRVRNELLERGIILEDMRDGTVRWKRK